MSPSSNLPTVVLALDDSSGIEDNASLVLFGRVYTAAVSIG
jgi:hypothetical protein